MCVQWLLQRMLAAPALGDATAVSKLVPVPKSSSPADALCYDKHRGIAVSALFARLLDRLVNTRLQRAVERLNLRSPTQCGFRPGCGTIDAVFTLQHLIASAQHSRKRLYAVFVDFTKAFDTVRRDLLLERCRALGIHGPFLNVLTAMYDKVLARVCVNGVLGEPFATTLGTKQGSELSPLLFGLFVELLHVMLAARLPGAGPVLSGLHVPDIKYADDVTLLSYSAAEAQQLLDVLEVFCRLFCMEVNMGPNKTAVVVFRPPGTCVPRGFRLLYKGQEVRMQQEYTYLGVLLHATKGLLPAAAALAASGSRAMHALLAKARKACLTQFDVKTRAFDALVEPVFSYGCQVWGPFAFSSKLRVNPFATKAEKVHAAFLRHMCGAGKGVSLDVLYADLHRLPVMYHWCVLAVRWWGKMSKARVEPTPPLACRAWLEDVKLALSGCNRCWSYHVLHAMAVLGLAPADWRAQPFDWVTQQCWAEQQVKEALAALWRGRWPSVITDPRTAPSKGVAMCTYQAWVRPVLPTADPFVRASSPPHTRLCLPFSVLRAYAQLRIGWAHLEVEQGRKRRPVVPREQRLCRLCCGEDAPLAWRQRVLGRTGRAANVEDLKHFLLECPAYDTLRAGCVAFPENVYQRVNDPDCLVKLLSHEAQASLAWTVHRMQARRASLLEAA
jgi:hypothetical protein